MSTAETHILGPAGGDNGDKPRFHLFRWHQGQDPRSHLKQEVEIGIYRDGGYRLFQERVTPMPAKEDRSKEPAFKGDYDGNGIKTEVYQVESEMNFIFEAVMLRDQVDPLELDTQLEVRSCVLHKETGSEYELCVPADLRIRKIQQFYDFDQIGETEIEYKFYRDKWGPENTNYPLSLIHI